MSAAARIISRPYPVTERRILVSIGRLFASGLNTAQIAAKLGLTEAQVYNARLNRSRA
jgi:DNA-binding NarL/FixJ family response regulator